MVVSLSLKMSYLADSKADRRYQSSSVCVCVCVCVCVDKWRCGFAMSYLGNPKYWEPGLGQITPSHTLFAFSKFGEHQSLCVGISNIRIGCQCSETK